MTGNEVTVN